MKVALTGLLISGNIPHSKAAVSGSFVGEQQLLGVKFNHLDIRLHGVLINGSSGSEVTFIADTFTVGELVQCVDVENTFGNILKAAYREPCAGDLYKHHNGNLYLVIVRANDGSNNPDYPTTIVYKGRNGNIWSKSESNFIQKMSFVKALSETEIKEFEIKEFESKYYKAKGI